MKKFANTLSKTVLSTGGGMPLREENAKLLKKIGKVCYLNASADSIYSRVKYDTGRPLLQVENPYAKISEMLEVRNPIYGKVADNTVVTDNRTVLEIADEILSNI